MIPHRRRSGTIEITTEVEIDPWDVLEAITDDELIKEAVGRKLKVTKDTLAADKTLDEALEQVLEYLRQGRVSDATVYLERLLHPKFSSLAICISEASKIARAAQGEG